MNEMTGFRKIWIADYCPLDLYGTVQLVGVKPKCWRGLIHIASNWRALAPKSR